MQRFCFVALVYCLFVTNFVVDGNNAKDRENVDHHKIPSEHNMRQIPGGENPQNPSDPKYREMANEALDKYVRKSGSFKFHKILQVESVTVQVVAGTITRINFYAAPTNCLLTGDMKSKDTQCVYDLSNIIVCHSETFEQPWNGRKDVQVACVPSVTRK